VVPEGVEVGGVGVVVADCDGLPEVAAGDDVLAVDVGSPVGVAVWLPICPHTPPAMRPTTAAMTRATATSAPVEMAPPSPRTLLLTNTP